MVQLVQNCFHPIGLQSVPCTHHHNVRVKLTDIAVATAWVDAESSKNINQPVFKTQLQHRERFP
jgi:hypothetical protein